MIEQTQLLCTFAAADELAYTVDEIKKAYKLSFNKLYVLENVNDSAQLVLTYNIVNVLDKATPISTIAVHRKKQTNTIYTINAINKLIEANNNGILDKTYRINWEELKNTVLVTAYGKLKIVNTKLLNIINF